MSKHTGPWRAETHAEVVFWVKKKIKNINGVMDGCHNLDSKACPAWSKELVNQNYWMLKKISKC